MRVRPSILRIASCALVFAALLVLPRVARAEPVVDLYTVGPGSYLYSTYGHSILCVRDAAAKPAGGVAEGAAEPAAHGACYDYGVAAREDVLWILWSSLRAKPIFVPVKIDAQAMVSFFEGQGRAIARQTLPLAPSEAKALADRLEEDVVTKWSYAYHPYTANCASQLRDRIDAATNGRLHAGPTDPGKATYRQRMEAGLTGRMFELAALALILGPTSDRAPNGWEAMFLPEGLRDGVADRLGVKAEPLAERQAVILPTSAGAGKLALFLLAFGLFLGVRLGARTGRLRLAVAIAGAVLGLLAIAVDATALVSTWVEFSWNGCLLVLLPTDLALGFLEGRVLRGYARVRLGMVLVVGLLELVGVVSQPMLAAVALVALPMAGLLGALRVREAEARNAETPRAAEPTARAA